MQQEQEQDQDGLFARWRTRLAHNLLRKPSVILIERDADGLPYVSRPDESVASVREAVV